VSDATKVMIESTVTATLTIRFENSTSGWKDKTGVTLAVEHVGQSRHPRPEPVRRTAPPVTTSSA
jgi:hypothetical protein